MYKAYFATHALYRFILPDTYSLILDQDGLNLMFSILL